MARKRFNPQSHGGGNKDMALVQGNTLRMSAVGKKNEIWDDLTHMNSEAAAAETGVGMVLPYVKNAKALAGVADRAALDRDMDLLVADLGDAQARRNDIAKRIEEAKSAAALHTPQDVFAQVLEFGEEFSQHLDGIVRVCLVDVDRVLDHFRHGADQMDIPYVSPYSEGFHQKPTAAVVETLNELNEPHS